jgi:hypothetical protein
MKGGTQKKSHKQKQTEELTKKIEDIGDEIDICKKEIHDITIYLGGIKNGNQNNKEKGDTLLSLLTFNKQLAVRKERPGLIALVWPFSWDTWYDTVCREIGAHIESIEAQIKENESSIDHKEKELREIQRSIESEVKAKDLESRDAKISSYEKESILNRTLLHELSIQNHLLKSSGARTTHQEKKPAFTYPDQSSIADHMQGASSVKEIETKLKIIIEHQANVLIGEGEIYDTSVDFIAKLSGINAADIKSLKSEWEELFDAKNFQEIKTSDGKDITYRPDGNKIANNAKTDAIAKIPDILLSLLDTNNGGVKSKLKIDIFLSQVINILDDKEYTQKQSKTDMGLDELRHKQELKGYPTISDGTKRSSLRQGLGYIIETLGRCYLSKKTANAEESLKKGKISTHILVCSSSTSKKIIQSGGDGASSIASSIMSTKSTSSSGAKKSVGIVTDDFVLHGPNDMGHILKIKLNSIVGAEAEVRKLLPPITKENSYQNAWTPEQSPEKTDKTSSISSTPSSANSNGKNPNTAERNMRENQQASFLTQVSQIGIGLFSPLAPESKLKESSAGIVNFGVGEDKEPGTLHPTSTY